MVDYYFFASQVTEDSLHKKVLCSIDYRKLTNMLKILNQKYLPQQKFITTS